MTPEFDVVIIGGGPAGSAAALTLCKRSDIRIAMVERGTYDQPKVGESLSPGVRDLLQYLDLWGRFESEHKLSLLGNEAAWGSDTLGTMDFILTLHGAGWALDRQAFDRMMADEAEQRGVTLMRCTSVKTCTEQDTGWHVHTDQGTLTARYIIDAAGRVSPFAVAQGARRQRNDTLMAVAARLPCAPGIAQMTRVEAFEHGWWYAAPVPSGQNVVCLFSDADRIHALRLSDPANWWARLQRTTHIAPLIGEYADEPVLEVLPAFSSLLVSGAAARPMIAAGDAVAARDPLSSSGIPNAIGTGIQAARVAADWLYGAGQLRSAYLNSVAQDHHSYLRNHWKTYRTEPRWPDAPFWRFRLSQVTRGPNVAVSRKANVNESIFVPRKVASWIADQSRFAAPQIELVTKARQIFPDIPDERLLLAIEDLTDVHQAAQNLGTTHVKLY